MTRPKLLVVDDGDRTIELAHALLRDYDYATRCTLPGPCWTCPERPGCDLTHAHDASEADEALAAHPDVDVVLLDVAFDLPEARLLPSDAPLERRQRLQGLHILRHLRRRRGALPVVLMTSREELALEDEAPAFEAEELVTLAGADAYDARALGLLVERILARRHEAPAAGGYAWGASASMGRLRQRVTGLARTSLPALVVGEAGTGKSALAEHVLHPASGRTGPFVAADLAAMPPQLVAAELFGTVRGAFSGAVERDGLFLEADGGTLLLDEVGNLPPEVQRMLLVTLQSGRVRRLGETMARAVDVKVVAATNRDLEQAVKEGDFRADLYARLNPAARLTVPPLRHRLEDLGTLVAGFAARTFADGTDRNLLAEYLEVSGIGGPVRARLVVGGQGGDAGEGVTFVLSKASYQALRAHPWPGNVRELYFLVANATLMALSDALTAAEQGRGPRGDAARVVPIPARLVRELLSASWAPETREAVGGVSTRFVPAVRARGSLRAVAQDLERQLYLHLYQEAGGDFAEMARVLLGGDGAEDARRVRLRFNQLGLRVRKLSIVDS